MPVSWISHFHRSPQKLENQAGRWTLCQPGRIAALSTHSCCAHTHGREGLSKVPTLRCPLQDTRAEKFPIGGLNTDQIRDWKKQPRVTQGRANHCQGCTRPRSLERQAPSLATVTGNSSVREGARSGSTPAWTGSSPTPCPGHLPTRGGRTGAEWRLPGQTSTQRGAAGCSPGRGGSGRYFKS